jgi:hypothetical protein
MDVLLRVSDLGCKCLFCSHYRLSSSFFHVGLTVIHSFIRNQSLTQLFFCLKAISSYLAYTLFVLGDICLICITIYLINGVLFWISYQELSDRKETPHNPHTKKEL